MMQSCKPAVAGIVTKKPILAGKLVLRPLDTRYSYLFLDELSSMENDGMLM